MRGADLSTSLEMTREMSGVRAEIENQILLL